MANSFDEAFVLCLKCKTENVVHKNKPPKFCSECGESLQPPINSTNPPNTKAVNESVEKLEEPTSEKSVGDSKPITDLSTDSPNDEPCSVKPPINKPTLEKPDDNPSSTMLPPDHKLTSEDKKASDDELTNDELSDDNSLSDIPLDDTPLGHIPQPSDDNASDDNASSDKTPDDKSLNDKSDNDDDNVIGRKVR